MPGLFHVVPGFQRCLEGKIHLYLIGYGFRFAETVPKQAIQLLAFPDVALSPAVCGLSIKETDHESAHEKNRDQHTDQILGKDTPEESSADGMLGFHSLLHCLIPLFSRNSLGLIP